MVAMIMQQLLRPLLSLSYMIWLIYRNNTMEHRLKREIISKDGLCHKLWFIILMSNRLTPTQVFYCFWDINKLSNPKLFLKLFIKSSIYFPYSEKLFVCFANFSLFIRRAKNPADRKYKVNI